MGADTSRRPSRVGGIPMKHISLMTVSPQRRCAFSSMQTDRKAARVSKFSADSCHALFSDHAFSERCAVLSFDGRLS